MKMMHINRVPKEGIDLWNLEVNALSTKKQKLWKGSLTDKKGTRQRVRFVGSQDDPVPHSYQCYNPSDRSNNGGTWVPIVACEDIPKHECTVISRAGQRLDNSVSWCDTFNEIIHENHTGNHYRNRSIAVPTRAGEPVRA
jgi:hypothetical protein